MVELYEQLNIEQLLKTAKKQEIYYINSIMFSKGNEYANIDEEKYKFFFSLSKITSLSINTENAYEPFKPAIVIKTGHSSSIDDVTDEDIKLYGSLIPKIINPELLSRVADVLWVVKKDYKSAQKAIESYLQSARLLEDNDHWPLVFNRVERALRIAVLLGTKSKYPAKVIEHIQSQIDKRVDSEETFLIAKCLALFQEFGFYEKSAEYSKLCFDIAEKFEKKEEWIKAREYLNIKSRYDEHLDEGEKPKTLKYISDLFVKEGEKHLSGKDISYSHASYFFEKALVALRSSGEYDIEQKELHNKLLSYQKKSLKEFRPISKEADISGTIEETKKRITGKSFLEALISLATIYKPTPVSVLRKRVEENSKYFISQHLFGGTIVNESGMVTGRYPSRSFTGDTEEDEESIKAQMIGNSQLYRQLEIPAYIEPARFIINLEHPYKISDLYEILCHNPFVPPGREYLYAKGLYEGLKGDFINACHILIPQLENSIRFLLQQNDEVTSSYSSKGIQDERPLTVTLVDYPILKTEILGEDLHYELSSILIDRCGSNLRNRFAHGLINTNGFYTYDVIYLWWLTLRLCCHPLILAKKERSPN